MHSFWMQVFSTREVHKALRVLPAHADEAMSSSALPAWRPRWRTGGSLHLTHALFRVQRQLDGQRITCQLLPNQDGSFALSVRGQGLVSCSTVPDCQRLFETAFPQVSWDDSCLHWTTESKALHKTHELLLRRHQQLQYNIIRAMSKV